MGMLLQIHNKEKNSLTKRYTEIKKNDAIDFCIFLDFFDLKNYVIYLQIQCKPLLKNKCNDFSKVYKILSTHFFNILDILNNTQRDSAKFSKV